MHQKTQEKHLVQQFPMMYNVHVGNEPCESGAHQGRLRAGGNGGVRIHRAKPVSESAECFRVARRRKKANPEPTRAGCEQAEMEERAESPERTGL